jgi:AraC-like DNA-binding protein
MKVIRESTHISGFLYDKPLAEAPALTHCGEALCARGHVVSRHAHPGFEFHYLSRGGPFGWRTGSENYSQKTGEIFVTYPNEPHLSAPDANPESHFLWIGLKLGELEADGKRIARLLIKRKSRLVSGCQEVEPVLRGVIAQVISRRPHRGAVVRAYLQAFIALLEQRILAAKDEPDGPVAQLPYSHGVMKAVAYLQKNLDRRVPLEELAAAASSRSTTNFCTRFRREVGVPPAAYHLHLRLQGARAALRQPAFAITTVAYQFGFNSSQHFSFHFRREFGITPSKASQLDRQRSAR